MIKNVSVLGAGTMGHAIATTFAMYGCNVKLYEAFESVRATAMQRIQDALELMAADECIPQAKVREAMDNITVYDDLAAAVADADYVIEAAPENVELKQKLFLEIDALCPAHTIFGTNTSSLKLADISALLPEARKAKVMVCHWYNPAHLIPIIELSAFGNMSDADYELVHELYVRCEKQPVKILKDIPGMIANRMLHALAREVFHLVEIGAASPEDIDRALKFGPCFRSATTGMLEVADMGGLDIWCAAQDNFLKDLDNSDKACDMLRGQVESGNFGFKTGKGFFDYPEEVRSSLQGEFHKRLIAQLKVSKGY